MTSELRDSGQGWLGSIPAHWELRPLGSVLRERKTTVSDTEYPPLSVTMSGVVPQIANVALTDNNDSRKLVKAGDYVINSRSDRKGSGGLSSLDGSVSVISTVLRPTGIEPRYAHHLLRSTAFQEEFYRWGSGIVADLWSTRYPAMRRIVLPLPPRREQVAIADFLDRETTKIDALIDKQQTLISLLHLRLREVIWATITAGSAVFDATLNRASRGLPTGWAVGRVHYDYEVVLGKMLDAGRQASDDEMSSPYIRAANVQDSGLDLADINSMPFRPSELTRLSLRRGDLLVVEGGASYGKSAWLEADLPGWGFQKTINRVRSRGASSTRFLGYVLKALRDRGILALECDGSTLPHLTAETLRGLRIPRPPVDEQDRLADFLDRETGAVQSLIAKAEGFISLTRERRAALITAAVTGQLDVSTGEAV